MRPEEIKTYWIGEAMMKHNVERDPELEPVDGDEDLELESLSSQEIKALEVLAKSPKKARWNQI